ncbi:MAG: hypothetical protein IPI00_01330 [Flavobacteriales bacterium]|nr:hypothetical protein [Flavobacteriales bacterium]MBK6946219.1 hypothetical protein [Flavobacteriales bacterium]MBK7238829.1 hypothetical protein [Flavobacteriales bacterium]MBK7297602.1 hypothetical protein [Flavobacteriales bacterium]MBK9537046.1 hypothetical protein [Flavobacteriales bacterium]
MLALPLACLLLLSSQPSYCAPLENNSVEVTEDVAQPLVDTPTALFDKAVLQDLLKNPLCTAIRFYNALATSDATSYTVIAIGIDKDGKELNGGKAYRMYDKLESGKIVAKNLTASKASAACIRLTASGKTCSTASMEKPDIEALLAMACDGIQITEEAVGKDTGFRLVTISIIDDKVVIAGTAPDNTKVCGDPCPSVCGPMENYLKTK